MKLSDAMEYLNYCASEGAFDLDIIEGMTSDKVIKLATEMMDKGDAMYENWKEEHEN